jgi:hypothetical protein
VCMGYTVTHHEQTLKGTHSRPEMAAQLLRQLSVNRVLNQPRAEAGPATWCSPRHSTPFAPSSLEFNDTL